MAEGYTPHATEQDASDTIISGEQSTLILLSQKPEKISSTITKLGPQVFKFAPQNSITTVFLGIRTM
jgi:hypothetical protein